VNLSVVLGIVWNSYMGHAFVADRYLYLPAVGLTIAAVAGMGELAPRMGLPPRGAALAGAVALAALAVGTWRQVPVWHDSDALWTYTLAHNPDCVPCHENLGLVLLERGELDAAAAHYERARRLGIGSNGAVAFCVLRQRQGRLDEAAELCELGRRLDPSNPNAPDHLGIVRDGQGRSEEAIALLAEAVRLDPGWAAAYTNLGVVLLRAGRYEEAKGQFETALRLAPGDPDARENLATVIDALAGAVP
jgi:tetratricopeptide (TPR) repeat protein